MKINLVSSNEDLSIEVIGKISKDEELWLRNILDHAWFKKTDVNYNSTEGILTIRLKRHEQESKAKKKFLGGIFWNNSISPTRECLLTIRDIERCDIRDEESKICQKEIVITGGLVFNNQDIYIGSFCEHENAYGVTLKVKGINTTLEDI